MRYAYEPARLATAIADNTILTQEDDTVVAMTVAFGAMLGLLVQGNRLDAGISDKLMKLVKSGELPFHEKVVFPVEKEDFRIIEPSINQIS